MGLVDDQQVEAARIDWLAFSGQFFPEQPHGALPFQEVDGRDQAREVCPGVDMDATTPAEVFHQGRIHDAKLQPELVAHLVVPVDLKRRRADDQDAPRPVANDQLLSNQPGFNSLAETHVVGDQ